MARAIVMPSFGMYTAEGVLAGWLAPQGARVEAGEPVLEIETEKSVLEVTAPESGILHRVAEKGARLQVESLIGYVLAPGEQPPQARPATDSAPSVQPAAVVEQVTPSQAIQPNGSSTRRTEILASPIARRLAAEHGIELSRLNGTGPGGRITEADVRAALAHRP